MEITAKLEGSPIPILVPVLIDDQDYEKVKNLKWKVDHYGYVVAYHKTGKKRIHRIVMDAPKGSWIDHVNGDKLDNRRSNLRFCSRLENRRNSKPCLNRGYKGVFWTEETKKFRVIIDDIHVGYFSSEEAAANCYNYHAKIRHKEFARLNVVNIFMEKLEWEKFQKKKRFKFKGVEVTKSGFYAKITVNSKTIHIGAFESEVEAAAGYNEYVIKNGLNRKLNDV